MARKRKPGRQKGNRKLGYFPRKGRGWFLSEPGEPKLCDTKGNHLRDTDDLEAAADAYAAYRLTCKNCTNNAEEQNPITVSDACQRYLAYAERHSADATVTLRRGFLFDLCTGFPAGFADRPHEAKPEDRIHPGYGKKAAKDLTPADMEAWVAKHPGWHNNRAAIQAVRRVLNYCVKDLKVLACNPILGVKSDQSGSRVTYFPEEVEQAIYQWAEPDLAQLIRFGIMAGTRPMCEYGSVKRRHVEIDEKGNMLWHFPMKESKVKTKDRYIHIPTSLKPVVEAAMEKHPTGPLFRNRQGEPWTYSEMKWRWVDLRANLLKKKVPIQKDDVIYTSRHTFAKRQLGGYWGPAVSLEILAGLMGNTPAVCWKNYSQWCSKYMDPLRNAVNY
ncbi:MAG: hypothetical protein ABSG53_12700 [Thermoguttaceae bacterium]